MDKWISGALGRGNGGPGDFLLQQADERLGRGNGGLGDNILQGNVQEELDRRLGRGNGGIGDSLLGTMDEVSGNWVNVERARARLANSGDKPNLQLGLFCTHLSKAAFENSKESVQEYLNKNNIGVTVLDFSPYQELVDGKNPLAADKQFYVASGPAPECAPQYGKANAFFLVFRGSSDTRDWLADFGLNLVNYHGLDYHGGFGSSVYDNEKLRDCLRRHLGGERDAPLFITGHSLGGALAETATCLVPHFDHINWDGRPIVTVSVAGPGVLNPGHQSEIEFSRLPDAARHSRVWVFVNGDDLVPRSLSTPNNPDNPLDIPSWPRNFQHLPQSELIFLKFEDDIAVARIPTTPKQKSAVLSTHTMAVFRDRFPDAVNAFQAHGSTNEAFFQCFGSLFKDHDAVGYLSALEGCIGNLG